MRVSAFREKLPSALGAIAIQVALAALLALSFEAVRRSVTEKETILLLPPAPLPKPPDPMVIDARGARKPAPTPLPQSIAPETPLVAAPPAPPATIAIAPPPTVQAKVDCSPDVRARMMPERRAALCPPPPPGPNDVPLQIGDGPVKDEEYFAAEKARRDAPFTLPGAEAGPLGVLLTALLNPSAFADKRNYNGGLPPRGGATPPSRPPPRHATDAEFQKALKAVNDRKAGVAAKPSSPDPQNGPQP